MRIRRKVGKHLWALLASSDSALTIPEMRAALRVHEMVLREHLHLLVALGLVRVRSIGTVERYWACEVGEELGPDEPYSPND